LQSINTNPHLFGDSGLLPEKDKHMVSSIIRFIQHWKRYGRVVQQLSRLSDRELADVGINRCDIDRIAKGQLRW
jgi:uncharacterized protein YjiS (DUF1127 family)